MISFLFITLLANEDLFIQKLFECDEDGLTSLVESGFDDDFTITGNYLTGKKVSEITHYFPHCAQMDDSFYKKYDEFYQYAINYQALVDLLAFNAVTFDFMNNTRPMPRSGIISPDYYERFLNDLLYTSSDYLELTNFITPWDQERFPKNTWAIQELNSAIQLCDYNKAKQILKRGIDINNIVYFPPMHTHPLVVALQTTCSNDFTRPNLKKMTDMISLLLEHGADINVLVPIKSMFPVRDIYFSPIAPTIAPMFMTSTFKELFTFLIENGLNPNALTSRGKHFISYLFGNILFKRQETPKILEDIRFYLDNGVDVNVKNPKGEAAITLPFDMMDFQTRLQLMDLFKSKGFDFDTTSFLDRFNNPFTRHFIGSLYGFHEFNEELFSFLKDIYLDYSPNSLNERNGYYRRTPVMDIMFALCQTTNQSQYHFTKRYLPIRDFNSRAEPIYDSFVELLESASFNPNLTDINGIDTLTYAINLCPNEVVEILVRKGAKIDTSDFEDKFYTLEESLYPEQFAPITMFNDDYRNEEFFDNL